MKLKKTPDISPSLATVVEQQHEQLASISGMILGACQPALRNDSDFRHFFGLEMLDCDMLRDAPAEHLDYFTQRCLYPFRPSRPIEELLAKGQTRDEISLTARLSANDATKGVIGELKIMWSTYVFSIRDLLNEDNEAWDMLGIPRTDAAVLSTASPSALCAMFRSGPYTLSPSTCLRGLLGPRRVLRPDELLRRCAADMSITHHKKM